MYVLRIEHKDKEDSHRRYLQHNPESTRHRYSPESMWRANKWRITRGSKRQADGNGSLAHYLSGLRRIVDAPHT